MSSLDPDPPKRGPSPETPIVVVGHGPRTDLLVVASLYPGIVAGLIALGWLASPKFAAGLGIVGAVGVVITVSVVGAWAYTTQATEQVVLSAEGIQRRVRLLATPYLGTSTPLVRWEWLDPMVRGPVRLGFASFRWHQPGGYLTWFQLRVTPTQARAIRAHPCCPSVYRDPDALAH